MHPRINAPSTVRHVAWLVVIGFLTLVLIGPVLALCGLVLWLVVTLLGFFLPFAVIGFLVWLPYRLLTGRGNVVGETKLFVQGAFQALVATPVRLVWRLPALAFTGLKKICTTCRQIGGILLETGCGGLLGAGLGWLIAAPFPARERGFYLATGLLVGAALGALVGLMNHLPAFKGQSSAS